MLKVFSKSLVLNRSTSLHNENNKGRVRESIERDPSHCEARRKVKGTFGDLEAEVTEWSLILYVRFLTYFLKYKNASFNVF